MATKVTVSGNYIYFTPAGGKPRKGATKDVKIYVDDDNADTFHVLGLFNEGNYVVSTADDNLLASDDTPYTAETFITFADSNTGNFNTGGATPLTKQFKATLTQASGEAPTVDALYLNTLGGAATYAYVSLGKSNIICAGAFPVNKTLPIQKAFTYLNNADNDTLNLVGYRINDNTYRIEVGNSLGSFDDLLTSTLIEIDVLN